MNIHTEIQEAMARQRSCEPDLPPTPPSSCKSQVPYLCFQPFAEKFRDADKCYCSCGCGCMCIPLKAQVAYAYQKQNLGRVVEGECCEDSYSCSESQKVLEALKEATEAVA